MSEIKGESQPESFPEPKPKTVPDELKSKRRKTDVVLSRKFLEIIK